MKQLLSASQALNGIAEQINKVYQGPYDEKEDLIKKLRQRGTEHCTKIVPVAHEFYMNLPKSKRMRYSREVRLRVANAVGNTFNACVVTESIDQIHTGQVQSFLFGSASEEDMIMLGTCLEALVEEHNNPNATDKYWERIKDSYMIIPYKGKIQLQKEQDGAFKALTDNENPKDAIKSLIGKKVIFYPIGDLSDYYSYLWAQKGKLEQRFEFIRMEVVDVKPSCSFFKGITWGEIGEMKHAWEYENLTKKDANELIRFVVGEQPLVDKLKSVHVLRRIFK